MTDRMNRWNYVGLLLLCCTGFALYPASLGAQVVEWTSLAGPNGGRAANFLFLPSGEIIVGTQNNGLLHSTDGGDTWFKRSDLGSTIIPLGVAPGGSIFAAGLDLGLIRSDDGGATWESKADNIPAGEVPALAVNADNHILAGTPAGVYRSSDNGESWVQSGELISLVQVLSLLTQDGETIYAGTLLGGFLISTDKGYSWESRSEGLVPNGNIVTSIARSASGELYVGTFGGGIFRSANEGLNWESFALANMQVIALAQHNGMLYAGTLTEGAWRMDANGNAARLNIPGPDIPGVAVHPDGDLFCGLLVGGVYRSRDEGANWQRVGLAVTTPLDFSEGSEGTMYVAAGLEGIHTYKPASGDWEFLGKPGESAGAVTVSPAGDIFVGGLSEIWHSPNGGENWNIVFFADAALADFHTMLMLSDGRPAAVAEGLLLISDNNGQDWRSIAAEAGEHWYTMAEDEQSGDLYLGGEGHIYRSADGGESREAIALESSGPVIGIARISGGRWYALQNVDGQSGQLYHSLDKGASWQAEGSPIGVWGATAFFADKHGALYFSGGRGVFRRKAGGTNFDWTQVISGLPEESGVSTVTIAESGHLYAGLENAGAWRSRQAITTVETNAEDDFRARLVPNPVRGQAQLEFSVPVPSRIRIEIRDTRGVLLAELGTAFYGEGRHTVEWNAENLAAGSYYAVLSGMASRQLVPFVVLP